MYADDTQVYCSFHSSETDKSLEGLSRDLDTLFSVSVDHAVKLNPSRSCALVFGRSSDILKVKDERQDVMVGTL